MTERLNNACAQRRRDRARLERPDRGRYAAQADGRLAEDANMPPSGAMRDVSAAAQLTRASPRRLLHYFALLLPEQGGGASRLSHGWAALHTRTSGSASRYSLLIASIRAVDAQLGSSVVSRGQPRNPKVSWSWNARHP